MQKGEFIYGRNPVLELLKDGNQAERIFLQRGVDRSFSMEIKSLAAPLGVPVIVVPRQKMERITRKNHQGVVAYTSIVEYQELGPVIQLSYEQGEVPLVVLLDGITDVRNVGAIARAAEVFGTTALVLPMRGGALINADTVKTSAGAIRHLTVCRVQNVAQACLELRETGVTVCVADQQAKETLNTVDLKGPVAIVMGSEGEGVHPEVLESADHVFSIPQLGKTESLNVSVATGVILYEVMRQRKTM